MIFRQENKREELCQLQFGRLTHISTHSAMLTADVITFHLFEYVRHFATCARRVLGVAEESNLPGHVELHVVRLFYIYIYIFRRLEFMRYMTTHPCNMYTTQSKPVESEKKTPKKSDTGTG
jgi:hypothetical protein